MRVLDDRLQAESGWNTQLVRLVGYIKRNSYIKFGRWIFG